VDDVDEPFAPPFPPALLELLDDEAPPVAVVVPTVPELLDVPPAPP
jgi:hypothetical protein